MSTKQKFYVVWKGRRTGIFETWEEASAQVNGFSGAQFKSFETRAQAQAALALGARIPSRRNENGSKPVERWNQTRPVPAEKPITPSYCADAACSGNPGVMEYRAVKTETGELVLQEGPFPEGTNNIGEFLGIVETLMLLNKRHDHAAVYSDSVNALAWVKQKKCKTQLLPNRRNAALFERIAAAEAWLKTHSYSNPLLKWHTTAWGEIPADYGRK